MSFCVCLFITAHIFQNRDDSPDSKSNLASCKTDPAFGKSLTFKLTSFFTFFFYRLLNEDVKDEATENRVHEMPFCAVDPFWQ